MKKYILSATCIVSAIIGLHSCMDFDNPGDEMTGNDELLEDVVYHGKADHIDFQKEISEAGFAEAQQALKSYLGQMIGAEYAMRGGKDGGIPESHAYQYEYSIMVDNYAGYLCVPHNFSHGDGGILYSTYAINQKYNDGPNGGFTIVKNGVVPLLNHPQVDSIPEIKAIALLLYDYSSQEMADLYGPFAYVDYKANKESHPYTYNTVRDIYNTIVDNIDTISACFKHYENRPTWYKTNLQALLKKNDRITIDHSIDTWNRFANSLKLRMAMHIVKVDPDKAKKWAEEAIAAGVIDNQQQEVALRPVDIGFTNPLLQISETWGDTRLNASFESILMSLKHPYSEYLFQKNSIALVNTHDENKVLKANSRIVGLRAGVSMIPGQTTTANPRIGYSRFATGEEVSQAPLYLMKISEVDFLRAEGALRGWNMAGTAQQFYERGISNAGLEDRSLDSQYANKLAEYKTLENAVDYTYIDPMDETNNIDSYTKIGVKWNEGDSQETKLEKIITQKYIAIFPYSYEAWTEARRTGYPKMFPVLNSDDGDGSLVYGDLNRRMLFPGDTEAIIQDIQTSGLKALEGEDQQATRLWWDVDGPNF
ncbi:SusD/RagB family nutrient-binding outer membrane lipoprotein [Bacteroides nordii]|uniref:SusD/RagB family nutrient-binding outer membrane lipoprotein n=1 Tax=Bacteroides nordii TaxID=291645 RepID=UPI00399A9A59